jgi:hypothetical protein
MEEISMNPQATSSSQDGNYRSLGELEVHLGVEEA